MTITNEQKHILNEIGARNNLKLMLLHGSYATGKKRPGSDLDIALLGNLPIEFDQLLAITGELEKVFGNNQERELDVKSLHKTDPLFRYQVAKDCQLLYGSLRDYSDFRTHAFAMYHDSKSLRNLEGLLVRKYQNFLNQKYALV